MDRFWNKVNKDTPSGCWEWTAGLRGDGYGCIKINGKVVGAHRFSYELHNGIKIMPGLYVCHKCDNPKCVNPDHLFLGTPRDNVVDGYKKGRIKGPSGGRVFEIGNKPINRAISDEIASLIKSQLSTKSAKELSVEFNVPNQLIRDIKRGRVYKNVA